MIGLANPRQLALIALREIYQRDAYTDIALDRVLRQEAVADRNRSLVTELVYGIVRRRRSLDELINQLGKKKAHQQPLDLRIVLQIGLYQLRYLTQIPTSAAVNTSVELIKQNNLSKLAGVVNAILREYIRRQAAGTDPLQLPKDSAQRLGVTHSFPDWLIERWLVELGEAQTEQLCQWFNVPAAIDIRINPLQSTPENLKKAFSSQQIVLDAIPPLPYAVRLRGGAGNIKQLPGFDEGWWTVQDAGAQLVAYLLDPQPQEVIIDACAAPGGKTTQIAELMQDQGLIWACDRHPSRLRKVQENARRLKLNSLKIYTGDSRNYPQFFNTADRVLLDAPCSGLGTLHKRPDIRWQQTPEKIKSLSNLQQELLTQAATWVKPQGVLVYATCTLNREENEQVIQTFLEYHANWQIEPPDSSSFLAAFATPEGWLKIWPHLHWMDGFFMVKLSRQF